MMACVWNIKCRTSGCRVPLLPITRLAAATEPGDWAELLGAAVADYAVGRGD